MANHNIQLTALAGVILSLTAVWLQWNLHRHVSRLEDKLKDGRLSADQVAQRVRWLQLAPVVCTLLGASLLFGTVLRAIQA
ncbi:MAG: hypothetical protein IT582_09000 [Opitutaceae bacterium]|nr:hypothetical protein [Opitutaceae bacterium]